jgi:mRNA-degrading endonuclease toxin of MazEF toxin-antitoxin module
MIRQGEIYFYSDPRIPLHPGVVVSREELNRGDRVVVAIVTSSRFAVRSNLPNCVPIKAGSFGLTKDCVVQGESIFNDRVPRACSGARRQAGQRNGTRRRSSRWPCHGRNLRAYLMAAVTP